jgi:hypothetical protein
MEILIILEKVLLFVLSVGATVFIVAACYPRTREKMPQLGDNTLMTQASDWLCIGVFGYFFLAFIILYSFDRLQNNIFVLSGTPSGWFRIISASFLSAIFMLTIYWCLAFMIRVLIFVLRELYYLIGRHQKTPEKKLRFIKSLQFYYAFLAAVMVFWFVKIVFFDWFLPLLLTVIVISAVLISWQKIINIYDFFHDLINNDMDMGSYRNSSFD